MNLRFAIDALVSLFLPSASGHTAFPLHRLPRVAPALRV